MPQEALRPLTLAVCQFAPRKRDVPANLHRLGALCADATASEPAPQVVLFPETATSGYYVEGGVRELAITTGALATELDEAYRDACAEQMRSAVAVDVIVGFYERWRDTLYNSVAYLTIGLDDGPPIVRHVHRKNYLPTYGMFDEERFVERGDTLRAFETPWGRAAMLICEDAWHSLSGTIAALDGAQVVFVVSAAPARGIAGRTDGIEGPVSVERWERLMRAIADEHGVFTCYANLVGTEGGKRFFGGSMIVGPAGDVRLRAPVWDEHVLIATVDLVDLVRARSDAPLLADLRTALPHVLEQLQVVRSGATTPLQYDGPEPPAADLVRGARGFPTGEFPIPVDLLQPGAAEQRGDTAASAGSAAEASPPRIPSTRLALREQGGPPPLRLDGALAEEWLCGVLRDECARRGYEHVVVALSGGVDSAVIATLAARALGPRNVTALRLPYRSSSPDSLTHAQLVIDALGIASRTIDISAAVDGYLAEEPEADGRRRGNVMARVRMTVLFDQSMKLNALPLGTGNKTERLLGYFTWHADDTPPVNLIGDLYKTQLWALARHLGVPDVIVDKVPSADLEPGQTDEGDLGIRYAVADEILHWLLHGWSPDALIARGFLPHDVHIVHARLERTHWKRRGPSVALVSNTAIGESYLRPVDY